MSSRSKTKSISIFVLIAFLVFTLGIMVVKANNFAAVLPFSQDWSNTGLITVDDDWSGVNSIIGYRGDGLTGVHRC